MSDHELQVTITYLQLLSKPSLTPRPDLAESCRMIHIAKPEVPFYRRLYDSVGEPWLWYERRLMSDEELRAIIQHSEVEIHVLEVGGKQAGYVELDFRQMPDVEVAYFGLMPEFIGRGFGKLLMRHALEKAWSRNPGRVWLHTCTLDHPSALGFYERSGFVPYKTETKLIDDPRPVM